MDGFEHGGDQPGQTGLTEPTNKGPERSYSLINNDVHYITITNNNVIIHKSIND